MELAVGGERLERLALEDGVGAEAIEHRPLEEEEPGVDPLLHPRLLDEAGDPVAVVDHRHAPLRARADQRHRRGIAVGAMEGERGTEIDVGDAVGVREREGPVPDPGGGERDPASGRRLLTGVETLDGDAGRPRLGGGEAGDHLAPVAGQQHEPAKAVGGVDPDDVPEDRPPADLDQRLRDRVRVLLQAGAATSAEDRDGLGALRHRHRADVQPPATAGRIVTSAPSLIAVSRPSWKRMSSPLT